MRILAFDTETTGLIDNHTVRDDKRPEVIEFYGAIVDLATGKVYDEFDSLVKPVRPITNTDRHGIDDAMVASSPGFRVVAPAIRELIEASPAVLAHNLSFDMEMLDIEFERLGQTLTWPKRRICSVEQTIHLLGHRLSLTDLHRHLFDEPHKDAHRARKDVEATVRCARELVRRKLL